MLTYAERRYLCDLLDLLSHFPEDEEEPRVSLTPETLRTACSAHENVVGTGYHKHRCGACGTAWKHPNSLPSCATTEEFATAHSCPSCGTEETMKYGGW